MESRCCTCTLHMMNSNHLLHFTCCGWHRVVLCIWYNIANVLLHAHFPSLHLVYFPDHSEA